MKKLFIIMVAVIITITANAQQTWDFSVVPTQKIDGTGNIETNSGEQMDTNPDAWGIIFNKAGIESGSVFMASSSTVFEFTKGLKWGQMGESKMVIYRNYPEAYGGTYLFFNKNMIVTIPAKTGQTIEFLAASEKNDQVITCNGIDTSINIDGTTKYNFQTYTCKVISDNPEFSVPQRVCIRKIIIKGEASGIGVIEKADNKTEANYNLSGQLQKVPVKGLNIQNKKKFLVR